MGGETACKREGCMLAFDSLGGSFNPFQTGIVCRRRNIPLGLRGTAVLVAMRQSTWSRKFCFMKGTLVPSVWPLPEVARVYYTQMSVTCWHGVKKKKNLSYLHHYVHPLDLDASLPSHGHKYRH